MPKLLTLKLTILRTTVLQILRSVERLTLQVLLVGIHLRSTFSALRRHVRRLSRQSSRKGQANAVDLCLSAIGQIGINDFQKHPATIPTNIPTVKRVRPRLIISKSITWPSSTLRNKPDTATPEIAHTIEHLRVFLADGYFECSVGLGARNRAFAFIEPRKEQYVLLRRSSYRLKAVIDLCLLCHISEPAPTSTSQSLRLRSAATAHSPCDAAPSAATASPCR